ncbi:MAG: nucleotidyltransferase family protein [Faecousia sp.]
MEREYTYLLHLLGAYLREEEPQVWENVDWVKLVQLSQIHCVTGILGYMTMSWPICPDEQMKASLRSVCLNTIALFARRAALADVFSQTLSRNGIDHIIMKGFVLREYYPVPELRTFGDIDLVIRSEDRKKSDELLRSLGYQPETDWEPVFSYTKDVEYYEIHSEIMEVNVSDKADYRGYFRDPWQYAEAAGDHRYQFKPEFHFLYLLTHIAKHVTGSGAGVRMYLDVAAFLRRFGTSLDWDWIQKELEKLRFTDFANIVLLMVQEAFGVESPIPLQAVEEETMRAFLKFTMDGGVFGRAGRDSGTESLKNQSRGREKISRIGTVARRLFPAAKTIESRYTYLQDKPWLLPAAWIHRLVKTRDTWQQHTEEAQNILLADKEEVRKIQKLYEKLGL